MNIKNDGSLRHSGERLVLSVIKKYGLSHLVEDIFIFDVGANEGAYALEAAAQLKSVSTQIFSFEPSEFIFNRLKKNVLSVPNITALNFGLGERGEELQLFRSVVNSGASSLYDYSNIDLFNGKETPIVEVVKIKRLEHTLRDLNLKKITFLKMDVEGHELFVLRSALPLIEHSLIDFIQFEFGSNCINSRVVFRDFWQLLSPSFRIYRMLPNAFHPINIYSFSDEVFYTTNYFCVSREISSLVEL